MALLAAEPEHAPRSPPGRSLRPAPEQGSPTAPQVQWRPTARLHRCRRHGRRLAADGPRDLQADAVRLADGAPRGLPRRALRALLADDRLRALLRRPHPAGDTDRLEQLPRDGHGLRGGDGRERGGRVREHSYSYSYSYSYSKPLKDRVGVGV